MLKQLFAQVFFVLALLIGPVLQAQNMMSLQRQIDSVQAASDENDRLLKNISFYANISGEEKLLYLNKEWQNGIIYTKDGKQLFFTGRFEMLNQIIEVSIDGEVWVLSLGFVSLIKIGKSMFIPVKRDQIRGVNKDACMELVYNGKTKLFAYYETETKQVRRGISESAPSETVMIYRERYFLSTDMESFRPLPPRKKMITELFQSQSQKVSDYIKERKLKRNRTDLIQLFQYYDQLAQ